MSRVANNPVTVPKGVDVTIDGSNVSVKGSKGTMGLSLVDGIGAQVAEVLCLSNTTLIRTAPWRGRPVHY